MRRWLTGKRVAVLTAAYFVLSLLGGAALVEISLRPPTLRPVNEAALQRATAQAQQLGATLEAVELTTSDNVTLKAWLVRPAAERANVDAVVLLHGVSDSRVGALGFAPFLLEHGYTLLLPDARAHGQSGGLATYGLLERNDVRAWARFARERITTQPASRARTGTCIYAFGASMGAAMALQSLADGAHDFCAVVVDSPFSDFKEVAFDRVGQPFGAGVWLGRTVLRPLVEIAFLYGRAKYGFEFSKASPREAMAGSIVPILLIHGEADDNIPIRHAVALKTAAPSIEYWPVAEATHTAAHGVAKDEYERRVLGWFVQHRAPAVQRSSAR